MTIRKLIAADLVRVPFPVAVDGSPIADGLSGACVICTNCKDKPCLSDIRSGEFECALGVRYVKRVLADASLTIYGLSPLRDTPRKFIDAFRGRKFPAEVVDAWVSGLEHLLTVVENERRAATSAAMDAIHDISHLAAEVASLANDLVRPYTDVGGRLVGAPALQLSVLKASELLLKEFDRLELLVNPASAATGRVYSQIYRLCHKYAQIIDLAYCRGNNKKVVMRGRSQMELRVFESISVLVFALIENAAKYGVSGEDVLVEVNDGIGYVDISVQSIGPLIEAGEVDQIFGRGIRGRWAEKSGQEGRGLGLHLAEIVADAHNVSIVVNSRSLGYERNSIPCAQNTFSIRVRGV